MKLEYQKTVLPSGVEPEEWNSWTWQVRNAASSLEDFQRWIQLSDDECAAFKNGDPGFQVQATPYALVLAHQNPRSPLRRILLPAIDEFNSGAHTHFDPLAERKNSATARIIHRYSDRALFLVTDFCSVYCRFCTRKHFTGKEQSFPSREEYSAALDYLRSHKGIREVILSGGDPLTLSNERLESVLRDLRSIEHLEVIRIGTRMPVVCPMRVDFKLLEVIKKFHPIYMMVHFNHPKELSFEAAAALRLLADAGVPLFNQSVLLNGVNNNPAILQALFRRLLFLRVKPYYLFQCDPSFGTDHLRTSVSETEEIQRALWGHLSGLAMPQFSLDIPEGGGKTAIVPNHLLGFETKLLSIDEPVQARNFKGWDGIQATYVDPSPQFQRQPPDCDDYQEEWKSIIHAKEPDLKSF